MEQSKEKRGIGAPVIAIIVAVALILIVAGAYCGFCSWVRDNGCLLPGTTAKDATGTITADLSGMTRDQAVEVMTRHMDAHLAARGVTITYDGGEAELPGTLLAVDPVSPIDYGMTYKAYQPFLRLGALWLGMVEDPLELSLSAAVLTAEGEAEAERLAQSIADKVYIQPVGYTCEVDEEAGLVRVTHGTEGRELDAAALAAQLKQALLEGASAVEAQYITLPTDSISAQMIYDQVFVAPMDPFELEDGTLTLPKDGTTIDVEAAQATLDATAPGQSCEIPLVHTEPDFLSCQHLLFRDVLAENRSQMDGNEARSFNVRRAVATCNGKVIMPGEVFSYLDVIGDPSVANGYMMGTGYRNGQTVPMEGGGVCQGSSAIYYCSFYAGMETVWRAAHAFVTDYMPLGLDATVSYPGLDFQFRNTSPYPIKIVTSSDESNWGYITVKILGTKSDDTYIEPQVLNIKRTDWATIYKPDETIPVGTTRVHTTAYTGWTCDVYRLVYDGEGNLISRTYENFTKHAKRDKVVLFNPADAERLGLNPDGTPVATFTLTVNWVDENGQPLAPQLVQEGMLKGAAYSTEQKEFEGYTFQKTTGDRVRASMEQNRTVTYHYTKDVVEEAPPVVETPAGGMTSGEQPPAEA